MKRSEALHGTESLTAGTYTGKKYSGFQCGANGATISLLKVNGVDTDVKTDYLIGGLVMTSGQTFFMPNGQWIHAITFTDGPIDAENY